MKPVIVQIPNTELYQVVKNGIVLTRPLSKVDASIALDLWPEEHINEPIN